jgi:hypothetical protein
MGRIAFLIVFLLPFALSLKRFAARARLTRFDKLAWPMWKKGSGRAPSSDK